MKFTNNTSFERQWPANIEPTRSCVRDPIKRLARVIKYQRRLVTIQLNRHDVVSTKIC